jgi:hypothetical protein
VSGEATVIEVITPADGSSDVVILACDGRFWLRETEPGAHRLGEQVSIITETVHLCPADGGRVMPCCGQTPFDVARTDRMTLDEALVTCGQDDTTAGSSQRGKRSR